MTPHGIAGPPFIGVIGVESATVGARVHAYAVTMRHESTPAQYEGSLAEPGDRNPYAGRSLVLAQLWMRGYMRMLRVRIDTGPAMTAHPGRAETHGEARRSEDQVARVDH